MNGDQLDLIASTSILVCAVMAIFNSLRFRSRGRSAFALAGAFVSLGITIYLWKLQTPQSWVIAGIVVTFLLLLLEFSLRPRQVHGGKPK